MIAVEHVAKAYRARPVLRGLDLQVPAGAVQLLVGANGAGKTTLLRLIARLDRPDTGRIRLNGFDVQADPRRALAELAFLPQSPRFHPRLTTRQVLTYYARLRHRGPADVDRELAEWDLTGHAGMITHHLSGGLRQRLAIAIFALARAPVLVLDEPGLSLDPYWRDRLQVFLTAEARRGRTILVATHLLAEWEGRVDTCHLMRDGLMVGELPPDRLRDAFASAEAVAQPEAQRAAS